MAYTVQQITNKRTWEEFINKTNPASFFQAWQWADIEKHNNSKRIAVVEGSAIKLLSRIVTVRGKRGTYIHVRNGPVYDTWNKREIMIWLDWLRDHAKKEQVCAIRISPLVEQSHAKKWQSIGFTPAKIHLMDGEVVRVLDLKHSDDALLMGMKKNTRNLIRKSAKVGIVIKASEKVDVFFDLYAQTYTRHGFIPHKAIKDEFEAFMSTNNADLLIAYHEKKPLASALVVYHGNQAIYRHGASIKTNVPATYALQWDIVRRARERQMKYYNLFGIADTDRPDHPWAGLTKFKLSFGGETKLYMHAHDLPLNWRYRILRSIESYEKKKRGY